MNKKLHPDIRPGLILVALAAFCAFFVIPTGIVIPENIDVLAMAPDFWPLLVTAAAGLASIFVVFNGFFAGRNLQPVTFEANPDLNIPKGPGQAGYRLPLEATFRVVFVIATLFGLYAAIPYIGIVAGSMILLIMLIRFAGEQRWHLILPVALILPMILYGFFVHIASVPMPLGMFEQFR